MRGNLEMPPAAEPEIFAEKFVDNSWLAELNKAKNGFVNNNPKVDYQKDSPKMDGLNFEPCEKVLEMPPAAEPEFSQATGTHGNLPTQKLASIYKVTKKQITKLHFT